MIAGLGTAGSALADPPQGEYRQLAGVGSDTTQDVMNAMADAIVVNGQKPIASYDAFGSATVQTKANPACTISRPAGSGAGRTALVTQLQAGNGCLDFARSSSLSLGATTPGLTYVPFAVDAVSFAVSSDSLLPRRLTLQQVKDIYNCKNDAQGWKPLLPQAGSGTRSFWLSTLGMTEAQVTASPCIVQTVAGAPIQEHDGRVLDSSSIVPISVAQWVAQTEGTVADVRGKAVLGVIDGNLPIVLNSDFGVKRDVYNVVPTSKLGESPYKEIFIGKQSEICKNTGIITQYGFAPHTDCGSDTRRTS
ncbi:hypothetical protein G9H71_13800 [Motilibacter sp. E257]|uniref:PBP domain-containing protein n=2 Tax=Motilibacter deserti TaxID=2714956 RepID=A0ABX0GVM9_9ACTN|nr:substrate-binding domain-containing protein [Motilibacter deserti]NHC14857.1 hypothetical protein [Motilibacter deserti]